MSVIQILQGNDGSLSSIMSEEVRSIMARRNVNQTTLAVIMGINQTAVSARLRGRTPWKIDELETLAEFFGVPADSFLRIGGTSPRPDGRGPDDGEAPRTGLEPVTLCSPAGIVELYPIRTLEHAA